MASQFITSLFPGISTFTGDTDPNGALSATRGSTLIRTDAGNVATYLNTDGLTAWSRGVGVDVNGDLNLVGVDQILLTDNAAGVQVGSTGALNLLTFVTANGAEKVQYTAPLAFEVTSGGLAVNAGGITVFGGGLSVNAGAVTLPANTLDVALTAKATASASVGAALEFRFAYPGAGTTDVVLPARGLRVTDARVVSGGAGGSVQVQTAGGAGNVTDAMVPGAAGAVTRATSITNPTFASGATVRIVCGVGTVAGALYVTMEPA